MQASVAKSATKVKRKMETISNWVEGLHTPIKVFGWHIVIILQPCNLCIYHGIHPHVWLVTLHELILIHGCNIFSYIMKRCYQITIHLTSYNFFADPDDQNIWFVILFIYFDYTCLGGWSLHESKQAVTDIYLSQ